MLHANVLRGDFLSGEPLTFETTLRAMLAKVELETGTEVPSERNTLTKQPHWLRCRKNGRPNLCAPPQCWASRS